MTNNLLFRTIFAICIMLAMAGFLALLMPRMSPEMTVRYSPFYSHVFESYINGHASEAAFARLIGDAPENQKYITRMIESPKLERRRLAGIILGLTDYQLGDSVGAIIRALGDPDEKVRVNAAVGLSMRQLKIAEPAIKKALGEAKSEEERRQLQSCLDGLQDQ